MNLKVCKHGLFLCNNDITISKSLLEYGEYCEEEVELFKRILTKDDTVIDVGANIGTISVPLANFSKQVFAFEPQRLCYYNLCANISLNNLDNVACFQHIVGDSNGYINIPELDYYSPGNQGNLNLSKSYDSPTNCRVKTTTIDDLNIKPKLIKINTQGMDTDVLRGAQNTIKSNLPFIYVSLSTERAAFIIHFLQNLNYKVYIHTCPLFNSDNYCKNRANIFNNSTNVSIFASPIEMEFPGLNITELNSNQGLITIPSIKKEDTLNALKSQAVSALTTLADGLSELSYNPEEAMRHLKTAIAIAPNNWQLYNKAAPILTRFTCYEEALTYLNRALKLGGNDEVLYNKAVVLSALSRHEESSKLYKKLIEKEPNNPMLHYNLAMDLLTLENYEEGWNEFEWRFKIDSEPLKNFLYSLPKDKPFWDGSPLNGKRILIFSEQGAGDILQFVRYIKFVQELGGYTMLACFKDMNKILESCEGIDELVNYEDFQLPQVGYDVMVSLYSLPRLLKLNYIPSYDKYLSSKPEWKPIVTNDGPKVGIAWMGSTIHKNDFIRSCPLKHFNCLRGLAQFYSLQKGRPDRVWPNGHVDLSVDGKLGMIDLTNNFTDFNKTACLIEELDLVICVDTSIAHLSGALGKETWLLLGKSPDWRWGIGDKSNWYPNIKIFKGNDWEKLLLEVKIELINRLR